MIIPILLAASLPSFFYYYYYSSFVKRELLITKQTSSYYYFAVTCLPHLYEKEESNIIAFELHCDEYNQMSCPAAAI